MTELIFDLVGIIVKIATGACLCIITKHLVPWLEGTVVPWLKERCLYNTISRFVRAADKLAETGVIAKSGKKAYVVDLLKKKGVSITPEVDALIEAAVLDLDMAWENIWNAVGDVFVEDKIEAEVELSEEDEAEEDDVPLVSEEGYI